MGAVLVFLYKHAKAIAAWFLIIGAWAVLTNAVFQSGAFSAISDGLSRFGSLLATLASLIPSSVASINSAISFAIGDDGFGSLMFWLCGFDVFLNMFSFIAAQISGIVTFVVGMGTASFALYGLMWTMRQVQRFASALGGGEVPSSASPLN